MSLMKFLLLQGFVLQQDWTFTKGTVLLFKNGAESVSTYGFYFLPVTTVVHDHLLTRNALNITDNSLGSKDPDFIES